MRGKRGKVEKEQLKQIDNSSESERYVASALSHSLSLRHGMNCNATFEESTVSSFKKRSTKKIV